MRKSFVQRALTITFEIQSHIGEAGGFQGAGDGSGHVRRKGARHFFARDFHACEFVVESNAELPETECAECGFAAFDQREPFGRDLYSVGNARCEACGGRAVPSG